MSSREPPIKPHYPTLQKNRSLVLMPRRRLTDSRRISNEYLGSRYATNAGQNAIGQLFGRSVIFCPSAAIREGGLGSQHGWGPINEDVAAATTHDGIEEIVRHRSPPTQENIQIADRHHRR